jgi:hypothetical protein
MNTLVDAAKSASFQDGNIVIVFESGVEIRFPVGKNPRLAGGSPKQLSNVEISPYGLHWPDLDEDLSFRGIMAGRFGQVQKSDA